MTALPLHPTHPLSVADFIALGETEERYELCEGSLVMSPRPRVMHQLAVGELRDQLKSQVPAELVPVEEIDLDLQLVPPGQPGATVRAPDVVVTTRTAVKRVAKAGGAAALITAADVMLVVEIISPGSKRTDNVLKRSEYADAGIPYYWIIELEPEPALTACHLGGELGYVDEGPFTGTFTTETPFPVTLDLAALT